MYTYNVFDMVVMARTELLRIDCCGALHSKIGLGYMGSVCIYCFVYMEVLEIIYQRFC